MNAESLIGKRFRAVSTAKDATYIQFEGIVESVKGSRVLIQADFVMDRWSKKWAYHPTQCACYADIQQIQEVKGKIVSQFVRIRQEGDPVSFLQKYVLYTWIKTPEGEKLCYKKPFNPEKEQIQNSLFKEEFVLNEFVLDWEKDSVISYSLNSITI